MAFALLLAYIGLLYLRPQEYRGARWRPDHAVLPHPRLLFWMARRHTPAPQYGLVAAFVLAMVVSKALQGWLGGIPIMLGFFLPVVFLFVLVAGLTDSVKRHRAFMIALVLYTLFLAVHGIDQSASGIGWSGAELSQGTRITYLGIFNDPNDLALAFVIALPMLAYLFGTAGGFAGRLFWLAGMGTLLYGIFLTNSRGGMLSAAAQFLAFCVGRWGMLRSSIPAAAGLVGLAMLPSRLDNLDSDEASAEGRVEART
ncbi:MAG: O-antigen polymerase, partial [Betaproteobacteria bacterium]|nr:O-antigen polymerase [Betaproteobacteria bacterium]